MAIALAAYEPALERGFAGQQRTTSSASSLPRAFGTGCSFWFNQKDRNFSAPVAAVLSLHCMHDKAGPRQGPVFKAQIEHTRAEPKSFGSNIKSLRKMRNWRDPNRMNTDRDSTAQRTQSLQEAHLLTTHSSERNSATPCTLSSASMEEASRRINLFAFSLMRRRL